MTTHTGMATPPDYTPNTVPDNTSTLSYNNGVVKFVDAPIIEVNQRRININNAFDYLLNAISIENLQKSEELDLVIMNIRQAKLRFTLVNTRGLPESECVCTTSDECKKNCKTFNDCKPKQQCTCEEGMACSNCIPD